LGFWGLEISASRANCEKNLPKNRCGLHELYLWLFCNFHSKNVACCQFEHALAAGENFEKESRFLYMKKNIPILCVLSFLFFVFSACDGRATRPEQLIAGWWVPDGSAQFQSIKFTPHGDDPQRGKVNLRMMGNEISGEYEITPGDEWNRLAVTYTLAILPTTRVFQFTIEDDVLVLQEGSVSASTIYHRVIAE
jgi:hypothetical protein